MSYADRRIDCSDGLKVMIEHLVEALLAREQVILLFSGIGMTLLGGIFIADHVYWRLRARRFSGTLVGVREKISHGQASTSVYFPVAEYRDERGERILCETDTGSSSLTDKIPGRRVTLLVQTGKPFEGRILGITRLIFAAVFIVVGVVLGSIAVTQYQLSAWSFVVGVAILAALALMGLKRLAAGEQLESGRSFGERKYQERLDEKRSLPLLGADELRPRLKRMNARARRLAPIMGLAGLALVATGHWLARDLYGLLATGEPVTGRIVSYERAFQPNNQLYIYYPQVVFTTPEGTTVRFQDRTGSGAATTARSSGERVTVIYDPERPEHAMIYRGRWTWAAPLGLLTLGLLILITTLKVWIGRRHSTGIL